MYIEGADKSELAAKPTQHQKNVKYNFKNETLPIRYFDFFCFNTFSCKL